MNDLPGKERKRMVSLSKTRLRITGFAGDADLKEKRARIVEMFPETPKELDDILFNVSSEPIFLPENASGDLSPRTPKSD